MGQKENKISNKGVYDNDNHIIIHSSEIEEAKLKHISSSSLHTINFSDEGGITDQASAYSDEKANGMFRQIKIEGADIFFNDLNLSSSRVVNTEIAEPVLQMYFLLDGGSSLSGRNKTGERMIKDQHNIMVRGSFSRKYEIEGKRFRNFGIQLSGKFLDNLISNGSKIFERIQEGIINKKEETLLSEQNMFILPPIRALIYDIKNCNRTGHMKRLFMESKIIELFMMQAEQAENLIHPYQLKIKKEDVEKLHEAKLFVENNLLNDFTLAELSRYTGLNDFKLKKGFKQLFGNTVFGYLNQLKMDYAKRLLLEDKKTVFETSYILGYSEPHHFSAAFKKRFGYTPAELKK